jgi:hypothetical protein
MICLIIFLHDIEMAIFWWGFSRKIRPVFKNIDFFQKIRPVFKTLDLFRKIRPISKNSTRFQKTRSFSKNSTSFQKTQFFSRNSTSFQKTQFFRKIRPVFEKSPLQKPSKKETLILKKNQLKSDLKKIKNESKNGIITVFDYKNILL